MLQCLEQPCAQQALDAAAVLQWARAADAWDALTWVIARDPQAGEPLMESGSVRAYEMVGARSIQLPTLVIIYQITAWGIVIHEAQFREADAAYAGRA